MFTIAFYKPIVTTLKVFFHQNLKAIGLALLWSVSSVCNASYSVSYEGGAISPPSGTVTFSQQPNGAYYGAGTSGSSSPGVVGGTLKAKFTWSGTSGRLPDAVVVEQWCVAEGTGYVGYSGSANNGLGDGSVSGGSWYQSWTRSGGTTQNPIVHRQIIPYPDEEFEIQVAPVATTSSNGGYASVSYRASAVSIFLNFGGATPINGVDNVLIGQRLTGGVTFSDYRFSATNFQWGITGDCLVDWMTNQNATRGWVEELSAIDLASSSPKWAYKAPYTSRMIGCDFTIEVDSVVVGTVHLERELSVRDVTRFPTMDHDEGGGNAMTQNGFSAEISSGGSAGIGMGCSLGFSSPPGFGGGSVIFNQLCAIDRAVNFPVLSTDGFVLDNFVIYDGPDSGVAATTDTPTQTAVYAGKIQDQYQMRAMFAAPGGDSVPVTIASVDWKWDATVGRTPASGYPAYFSVSGAGATGMSNAIDRSMPEWEGKYTN